MKLIKALLIINLILSMILFFKIYNSNNKNFSKKVEQYKLELEEIKKIINKSDNINNYYLKSTDNNKIEIKYKDGKEVVI